MAIFSGIAYLTMIMAFYRQTMNSKLSVLSVNTFGCVSCMAVHNCNCSDRSLEITAYDERILEEIKSSCSKINPRE